MARAIMIQGTMSNAGKSLIAAGLCRIFSRDGYKTAPFKSQNMALNSYITEEGLEMGRAQAVQAEACGIKPSVLMNPILLKPTTDMGSQIIVKGEVTGNMRAMDYYRHKKEYIPVVAECYETLAADNDIIVIEGAGSPAEINLTDDDIVNMGMAKLADANVLLVGDIDRGGVFAQLYGTLALLSEDERERIKGLIINKFRGDRKILEPGLDMLYERCGKPVIGVVPYADIDIEDEDSLSERFFKTGGGGAIDIAVIKLPRISNFTDFQALSLEPQMSVRYVDSLSGLKEPDMIIVPGTKSTLADLRWLKETGLYGRIIRLAGEKTMVCGICGGYQMLGYSINDENQVEGSEKTAAGMGLLPVRTFFGQKKTRSRISCATARIDGVYGALSEKSVYGYEIHMGDTELCADSCGCCGRGLIEGRGADIGWISGNVFGTYIHGIFDSEDIRSALTSALCAKKGINPENIQKISYGEYRQNQYARLEALLRESLDMKAVYEALGIK